MYKYRLSLMDPRAESCCRQNFMIIVITSGRSSQKNQLDSFIRFDRTQTCDGHGHRQTDRHRAIASVGSQVYNFICPLKYAYKGLVWNPFAVSDCLSDI